MVCVFAYLPVSVSGSVYAVGCIVPWRGRFGALPSWLAIGGEEDPRLEDASRDWFSCVLDLGFPNPMVSGLTSRLPLDRLPTRGAG